MLRFVSERTPYARIADALGIRVETVRKHVAHIRRKIGVKSTPLAVLTIVSRDIVGYKLLAAVGVRGQAPQEFSITDVACRLLTIRLLTEHRATPPPADSQTQQPRRSSGGK